MLGNLNEKLKEWFSAEDLKAFFAYWCWFAASLLYWELLIKWITGTLDAGEYWFLCFIPAQALFFAILTGWGRELVNRFLTPILLALLTLYYMVQLGYYKIFGSLLSVALLGMGGDAMDGFGWTSIDTLKEAAGYFALTLGPVALAVAAELWKGIPRRGYRLPLRLAGLTTAVLAWVLAIGVLALGGTSRQSAYYAFFDRRVDTDTASRRLGASATTLVETAGLLFGSPEEEDRIGDLPERDPNAILIVEATPTPVPTPTPAPDETPQPTPEPPPPPSPNILAEIDFEALEAAADSSAVKALCQYYGGLEGTMRNQYTGLCKDYNLVYICAESFWRYAIDPDATPTLWKMASNGIILDNYYNSFKNTTTNGEFAFLTSLWPDVSMQANKGSSVGSMPQSATKYMPYGLGNITADQGYKAYGYHNFKAYYYKRGASHPNLGLQCKFMGYGMHFSTAWPSSDLEMMKQSVDDYINDDKFVAYYMTFSGHGPYTDTNRICAKNREFVTAAVEGKGYDDTAIGYLSCMRELDLAMEYLLDRLEEAGVADRTLVVITGDHYPYYIANNTQQALIGHVPDAFEAYKSLCIMYSPGIEEPIHTDVCCCNVDILPTVLNLMDIPFDSRMLAGTDIFSDGFHKAALYNKSFVTDMMKYDAVRGKAEWLVDVSAYSKADLDAYIDAVAAQVDAAYSASLKTMSTDFYRFVWENSGLHMQDPLPAIDTSWPKQTTTTTEDAPASEPEGGTPAGGEEAPAEGGEVPAEGGEVPAEGGEVPAEGGTTPADGGTTPVEGGTAPVEGGTASVEGGTAPVEGGTAPTDGTATAPEPPSEPAPPAPAEQASTQAEPAAPSDAASPAEPEG